MSMNKLNLSISRNSIFLSILVTTLVILLIIAFIGQLSGQINWNLFDFLVIGILIFGSASAYVLIARRLNGNSQKLIAAAAIGGLFLYVWAELAVGIFTNLGS